MRPGSARINSYKFPHASVDPTPASIVASASSAHKAWTHLHTAFANKSQTRIFSLRDQLAQLQKESQPITDYLHEVRSLSNELTTAGAPFTNEELIVKILSGLGPEFQEISAAIRSRNTFITYEELYEKLINHELFLKYEDAKKTPLITAAISQRTSIASPRNNNRRQGNNASPNNQQ